MKRLKRYKNYYTNMDQLVEDYKEGLYKKIWSPPNRDMYSIARQKAPFKMIWTRPWRFTRKTRASNKNILSRGTDIGNC